MPQRWADLPVPVVQIRILDLETVRDGGRFVTIDDDIDITLLLDRGGLADTFRFFVFVYVEQFQDIFRFFALGELSEEPIGYQSGQAVRLGLFFRKGV